MATALIFSDLHIHQHKGSVDRLDHCLQVLNWVFKEAAAKKCDYLFFLGDLFHHRSKIDALIYTKTFEIIASHMAKNSDLEFYLLVGNHDMYHRERWDVNSVKPLSYLPRVSIIESPTQIELSGTKIDWLPHVENPIDELNQLRQSAGDILFSHLAVNNAMLNVCYGTKADVIVEYDNDMVAVDLGLFEDWPQVFLGHYHGAQRLDKRVEYIGSPLQLSFGEAFQKKHILLLDLDTKEKTYIENKFSPSHIILKVEDAIHDTYDLNNNFVRMSVDDMGRKDLLDIKQKIKDTYKTLSFDIKQPDKKMSEINSDIIEDAKSILKDNREMLATYVEDCGVPNGMAKDHLLKLGNKCLEKQTQ